MFRSPYWENLHGIDAGGAAKLREAWREAGNKPCTHPAFEGEYMHGMNTGDKICTTCGECFSPPEMDMMRVRKQWGDKPCTHSELKEWDYIGGSHVCTTCGRTFYKGEGGILEEGKPN